MARHYHNEWEMSLYYSILNRRWRSCETRLPRVSANDWLLAPVLATRLVVRKSESKVPASLHQPSSTL